MKVQISKTEATVYTEKMATRAQRPQTPMDTYGNPKPTRTQPWGGFIGTYCFGDSYDQKKSPTSKPGNAKVVKGK